MTMATKIAIAITLVAIVVVPVYLDICLTKRLMGYTHKFVLLICPTLVCFFPFVTLAAAEGWFKRASRKTDEATTKATG